MKLGKGGITLFQTLGAFWGVLNNPDYVNIWRKLTSKNRTFNYHIYHYCVYDNVQECWYHLYVHPELSGCITNLTVCNTCGGCNLLCSNGHLDRSRCMLSRWHWTKSFTTTTVFVELRPKHASEYYCYIFELFILISPVAFQLIEQVWKLPGTPEGLWILVVPLEVS